MVVLDSDCVTDTVFAQTDEFNLTEDSVDGVRIVASGLEVHEVRFEERGPVNGHLPLVPERVPVEVETGGLTRRLRNIVVDEFGHRFVDVVELPDVPLEVDNLMRQPLSLGDRGGA